MKSDDHFNVHKIPPLVHPEPDVSSPFLAKFSSFATRCLLVTARELWWVIKNDKNSDWEAQ
jgi:hypothetical protein